MPKKPDIGRLALRVEGDNWVAYYAGMDTMEGAIPLGNIPMWVVMNEARKKQFMKLMQDVVADILFNVFGHRPTWNEPMTAPQSERAGRA